MQVFKRYGIIFKFNSYKCKNKFNIKGDMPIYGKPIYVIFLKKNIRIIMKDIIVDIYIICVCVKKSQFDFHINVKMPFSTYMINYFHLHYPFSFFLKLNIFNIDHFIN